MEFHRVVVPLARRARLVRILIATHVLAALALLLVLLVLLLFPFLLFLYLKRLKILLTMQYRELSVKIKSVPENIPLYYLKKEDVDKS